MKVPGAAGSLHFRGLPVLGRGYFHDLFEAAGEVVGVGEAGPGGDLRQGEGRVLADQGRGLLDAEGLDILLGGGAQKPLEQADEVVHADMEGVGDAADGELFVKVPADVPADVTVLQQPLENVYSQDEAYKNGTLFPNLNKPFLGGSRR